MDKHKKLFVANSLSGLCLILSLTLSEVFPVSSTINKTPQFFTARLILTPIWDSIKSQHSWVLLVPAVVLFIISLSPYLYNKDTKELKWFPTWIAVVLIVIGLSFFPLAYSIKDAQNIGPLWSLLFFLFAGVNLVVQNKDFFFAATISAFFWDMGAGIQGIMRSIPTLPEPYYNTASPKLVLVVDSLAILITIVIWISGIKPSDSLNKLYFKFNQSKTRRIKQSTEI
jgi:hypothetical protein